MAGPIASSVCLTVRQTSESERARAREAQQGPYKTTHRDTDRLVNASAIVAHVARTHATAHTQPHAPTATQTRTATHTDSLAYNRSTLQYTVAVAPLS